MTLASSIIGSSVIGGFPSSASSKLINNLQQPTIQPVFLAEITCGCEMGWWEQLSMTGFENVWRSPQTYFVKEMFLNGVALIAASSAVNVNGRLGTWFWDGTYVYVRLPMDADPTDLANILVAILRFRFSNTPKDLDGSFWEARIVGFPELSTLLDFTFSGIAQIGSGNLPLANNDKYFDTLQKFDWKAGQTLLYIGADLPNQTPLEFRDYFPFANCKNDGSDFSFDQFIIHLIAPVGGIQNPILTEVYTLDEFPNIASSDIGKYKQLAYGPILGVAPVCINVTARTFKVTNHAISSFDNVKVFTANVWTGVNFATTDISTGTFTLSALDWNGTDPVSVDFSGLKTVDGFLLNNPADVVHDILERVGVTQFNEDSFNRSKSRFQLGTNLVQGINVPKLSVEISLYITDTGTAADYISTINQNARAYLFSDGLGNFQYELFWPQPGEALPVVVDNQIKSFKKFTHDGLGISKVTLMYASRPAENTSSVLVLENPANQYVQQQGSPILEPDTLLLNDREQASKWGYRRLIEMGRSWNEYELEIPWIFFLILPASFIRITSLVHNMDQVLEVLGLKWSLFSGFVTVTASDAHNWDSTNGFWTQSGNIIPSRFSSDSGYNGGNPAWNGNESDELATWKKQNCGFWTNPNGFADNADARTRISRWF